MNKKMSDCNDYAKWSWYMIYPCFLLLNFTSLIETLQDKWCMQASDGSFSMRETKRPHAFYTWRMAQTRADRASRHKKIYLGTYTRSHRRGMTYFMGVPSVLKSTVFPLGKWHNQKLHNVLVHSARCTRPHAAYWQTGRHTHTHTCKDGHPRKKTRMNILICLLGRWQNTAWKSHTVLAMVQLNKLLAFMLHFGVAVFYWYTWVRVT